MNIDPTAAGMSGARLENISRHLLQRYVEPSKIAGCLTVVYRGGKMAYCEPLGSMDLERQKPMTTDAIFRIYSMTKPITSVALMTLYEQGHFQLSDPVHRFIPEWRDLEVYAAGSVPDFQSVPAGRPMTVRDLFTHTSGLTYGFMNRSMVDHAYRKKELGREHSSSLAEMIKDLADIPLEFSPGTRWNYSVATDVLGYLCEVISGQPFNVFLKERVIEPLGMVDTDFYVPAEKLDRFAANYNRGADKKLVLEDNPQDSQYGSEPTFFSGGGGLVSTAADYLRFCRMLLNGGELDGQRVLGPRTIALMAENHLPGGVDMAEMSQSGFSEIGSEGYGFGLGFSVNLGQAQNQTIGSFGEIAWGGAASTVFWVDPAEDLAVIFMTQLMPSGTFNFRGQLKALVYPAIVE